MRSTVRQTGLDDDVGVVGVDALAGRVSEAEDDRHPLAVDVTQRELDASVGHGRAPDEARVAEDGRARAGLEPRSKAPRPGGVLEEEVDGAGRREEPERGPIGFALDDAHLAPADVHGPAPRVLDANRDGQRVGRRVLGHQPRVQGGNDALDERLDRGAGGDVERVHGGNVAWRSASGFRDGRSILVRAGEPAAAVELHCRARMSRTMNFNPGPAALPLAALEKARDELLDFAGHRACR